eukprot:508687-Rhodomonas_salina.1
MPGTNHSTALVLGWRSSLPLRQYQGGLAACRQKRSSIPPHQYQGCYHARHTVARTIPALALERTQLLPHLASTYRA